MSRHLVRKHKASDVDSLKGSVIWELRPNPSIIPPGNVLPPKKNHRIKLETREAETRDMEPLFELPQHSVSRDQEVRLNFSESGQTESWSIRKGYKKRK